MNIDKKTCWYQNCADEMNKFYDEHHKPFTKEQLIEKVHHFRVFDQLIKDIDKSKAYFVIELGAGTGVMSKFFNEFDYTGCDLPNIVQECFLRNFPALDVYEIDILSSRLSCLDLHDIVAMSAFIDTMENPIFVLDKILRGRCKYVILHRQEISETKETHVIKNPSYGGYTYHSIINRGEFENLLKKRKYKIKSEYNLDYNWEKGGHSFLLERI